MTNEQYLKKAILTNAVITSLNSKADRSLGLRISTPELSSTQKAAFFDLQNVPGKLSFLPDSDVAPDEVIVDRDLKQKSQSSRLRAVIFVLWKQQGSDEDFETFYKLETEKIIDQLKGRIDEI